MFVADDGFPLSSNCMKAFGLKNASNLGRIFNYCLFRFRRIAEYGSGIWRNRFKLHSRKPQSTLEKKNVAVMASLALHSMLKTKSNDTCTPVGFIYIQRNNGVIEGKWRKGLTQTLLL